MKNLLVAIDFSKKTDVILEQATALAKALDAKLWVLHVAPQENPAMAYEATQYNDYSPDFVSLPGDIHLARDLSAEELKREHADMLDISHRLREQGADAQAILLKGDAAKLIVEKAVDLKTDIILLGSHGHGLLHKALLGSVSETVIRHAPCNVMIVPTEGEHSDA